MRNDIKTEPQISNIERLAGTWTEEDATEFEQNTAAFSGIDEDMWE